MECADIDQWEKVDTIAKHWISEKRKNVQVNIVQLYDNKISNNDSEAEVIASISKKDLRSAELPDTSSDDSENDDSDWEDSHASVIGIRKARDSSDKDILPRKKQRKRKTSKQAKYARSKAAMEKKHGVHGSELLRILRCDYQGCQNRDKYCWQPDGQQNRHYRGNNRQIQKWSRALSENHRPKYAEPHWSTLQRRLKSSLWHGLWQLWTVRKRTTNQRSRRLSRKVGKYLSHRSQLHSYQHRQPRHFSKRR